MNNEPLHHFEWRIRIFGTGAILGIAGMWLNRPWLINVAIAILGIGVVLRFRRRSSDSDASDPGDDEGLAR